MSDSDEETASFALRKFAGQVLRDEVDSEHLQEYVDRLLTMDLIELHASCRHEAAVLGRCFPGMDAREVAGYLVERARLVESAGPCSSVAAVVAQSPRPTSVGCPAARPLGAKSHHERCELATSSASSSWFPEIMAALAFIAAAMFLLPIHQGDQVLRLMAVGSCGLVGFGYLIAAFALAWHSKHPKKS